MSAVTEASVPPPIVATPAWQAAVDRAGNRCECTYKQHPTHRRHQGGRCEQTTRTARLSAGPATLGPRPDRPLTIPSDEELVVRCPDCWDYAAAQARAAQRVTDRDAQRQEPGLW